MKTFCEVMHVDTSKVMETIDNLPEDERERVLTDARQSAKEQQERLAIAQHEQWEKERNIKHGFVQNN